MVRKNGGNVVFHFKGDSKDLDNKLDGINSGLKGLTSKITIGNVVAKGIGKAFQVMSSHMDDAISRIDTLNNFPNVMKNLGISTKESQKAIDKISKALEGLPTTLDAGALAVQRFTSANGDVAKSTDMFIALNNALLAGGASTEIQATALEQLSQAYAKGKPDMMEWRSLQTAMPAQLKQVASAFNMTTAELGEALRKGDLSMDVFMGKIIELNKTGTGEFASFEEQAKNSTNGLRTNLTNLGTAITKGMTKAFNSLNKSLKKANLPSIQEMIAILIKKINKAFETLSRAMSKVQWNKVIKAIKILIPIVASLLAGLMAYKPTINIIKGVATAMKILNGTIALSINPIGLAVAGATALAVGLGLLAKHFRETDKAQAKHNQTMKEYKASMKEAEDTKQEMLNSSMSELSYYENLANELKVITDANGRVKKGYEDRAQFIATTLNEAIGTEIKITNGVIENYSKLEDKIKDVIKQKRAQYLLDAQEEVYNTAKNKRNDLEKQYTTDLKNNKKAIRERADIEKELMKTYGLTQEQMDAIINLEDRLMKSYGITREEARKMIETQDDLRGEIALFNNELGLTPAQLMNIRGQLSQYDGQVKKTNKALKESTKTYTENEKVIAQYENALGYMSDKNYKAVLKMYEDTTNYIGKTDKATYNNYQEAIERQKLYLDNLKKNKKQYDEDTYRSMVLSGEAQLKELQSEQAKYKTAVSEGQKQVSKEYAKSGSNNMVSYSNGISSKKENVKKKSKEIGNTTLNQLDVSRDAYFTGQNVSNGFANGMKSLSKQLKNVASSIAKGVKDATNKELGIHSPSKEFAIIGRFSMLGFQEGLEQMKPQIDKAINGMFNLSPTMTGTMNNTLSPNVNVVNNVNVETDPLGQVVSNIKTFSGGAKNDYNYGYGG